MATTLLADNLLAAVFQDFENLYYHLKQEYQDPPMINDAVIDIVRNLRARLLGEFGVDPVIQRAYADFERLSGAPLGSMYLMGIDTKNVLGTEHKNAADMRLCIDLMETLYTRPDIRYFVLVAGDRDYIPVVQHLRSQARQIKVVAFRKGLSGDLLEILGKTNVIDAESLLSDEMREALLRHKTAVIGKMGLTITGKIELPEVRKSTVPAPEKKDVPTVVSPTPATLSATTPPPPARPTYASSYPAPAYPAPAFPQKNTSEIFKNRMPVVNADARTCLEALLRFKEMRNVTEVWLQPFVRQLTDELPFLNEHERKRLLVDLERHGAIAIEKRDGDPYPYSVILTNYDHPSVMDML